MNQAFSQPGEIFFAVQFVDIASVKLGYFGQGNGKSFHGSYLILNEILKDQKSGLTEVRA
jgi:hypothetical protein